MNTCREVDAYINEQEESIRDILKQARQVIRETIPEAEERFSWGMPTYWKNHNIIHFAPAKKHLGIYPGPDSIEHFQDILKEKGYTFSKGAVRMPYGKLDMQLLREITAYAWKVNQ